MPAATRGLATAPAAARKGADAALNVAVHAFFSKDFKPEVILDMAGEAMSLTSITDWYFFPAQDAADFMAF